ncbi:MAG: hypothetical protein AAF799_38010 [Myxococcota bacterium]
MIRASHGRAAWLLATTISASACDPEALAVVELTAYGEEFVEDEIPASAFVDGWSIEFSRFVVALTDIEVDGEPLPGHFAIDLRDDSSGEGHHLGEVVVPAGARPQITYRVAPLPEPGLMPEPGASLVVEGRAQRGEQTISFAWSFDTDTRYEHCEGVEALDSDLGNRSELTLHADHLFYDDLEAPDPNLAFDAIAAADTDGDGDVTMDELDAVQLGAAERYQGGGGQITDLGHFIRALTRTLGHIDGEGHCEIGR